MVKALPKKREKGQPKIDGFLVKQKKRVTNNASKTPKAPRAPRAPIPKNEKIIDVDADADGDVILIDHKTGDRTQIDLTKESPEKEKPDPDFDISKSEGDKAVEPEFDPDATDDEMSNQDATDDDMSVDNDTKAIDLTLGSPEKPKLTYDFSVSSEDNKVIEPEVESKPKFMDVASMPSKPQKKVIVFESGLPQGYYKVLGPGNSRFGIDALFDPTVEEFEAHLLKIGRRVGCPFKVGIQIAEDGRGFMRNEDGGSYPECCYRKKDSLVAADGINTNEKFIALENCYRTCGWPTTNMNDSSGLIGPNTKGGRTFDGNTYGFVYVAPTIQDTLEKFYPVYRAFRVANAEPGQFFTPKGRMVRCDKGSTKVKYCEVLEDVFYGSKIDPKKAHDALKRVGAVEFNKLCLEDPELMEKRSSLTSGTKKFIDDHFYKPFLDVYKTMFPEHAATAGRFHGHGPIPSVVKSLDELIKEKKPKLSAVDIKDLIRRNYAVVIQQKNPRVFGKAPWKRYENYKKAKTVAELKSLKAETVDIIKDIQMGYVKLVVPKPP